MKIIFKTTDLPGILQLVIVKPKNIIKLEIINNEYIEYKPFDDVSVYELQQTIKRATYHGIEYSIIWEDKS